MTTTTTATPTSSKVGVDRASAILRGGAASGAQQARVVGDNTGAGINGVPSFKVNTAAAGGMGGGRGEAQQGYEVLAVSRRCKLTTTHQLYPAC